MSTSSDTAIGRPVTLRMRHDLAVRALSYRGRRYWAIKDPVSLRYFQLRDEEYFILRALDGHTSPQEIKERFEQEFAPRKLGVGQLQGFFGLAHRQGLIVADAPGQGDRLLLRRKQERRRATASALANVLAIRMRGVDPERFLSWLYPKCRWLFSTWALLAWFLLAIAALTLVAVQFDVLLSKLPHFEAFFSLQNAIWLVVALALTKVLHELAHGLACKHFGGECHEIGLMFLVFTPCLYCNVSDAWMLPNKWHRIAISAAGMLAEIGLASVCTFLWWFSEPGLLHALMLNVMVVCSVSTLVFNGNPLLRFDGYFIFADLIEVPNLQQRSRAVMAQWLQRVCGVRPDGRDVIDEGQRGLLASYAIASTVYRLIVITAILWFCHQVLTPRGLKVVAQMLTIMVVAGLVLGPAWRAGAFLRNPSRRRNMRWIRLLFVAIVTLLGIVILGLVPMPHRIETPLILEPKDARPVYVSVAGTLRESVEAGQRVETGEVLAVLENLDLMRKTLELNGRRQLQELRLENLKSQRVNDPELEKQIPAAEEALADLDEQLRQRQRALARLTLTAPAAGTVLAPPRRPPPIDDETLSAWSGSPLDAWNVGSWLETGTLLCLIGDPRAFEATLVVDQASIEFVRPGQRARVQVDALPGKILEGTIAELSEVDLRTATTELIATGLLPTREDAQGNRRPISTSYLARVELDEHRERLLISATGRAKISVAPRSIASRVWRYLRSTFRVGE